VVDWEGGQILVFLWIGLAGCVVVVWEKIQILVILCIGYCWLCSGRVRRGTVFGLIFVLNIAG
jgi:hypothetical protein